eukprot:PhM_4_TR14074/c0_g1_i1/m.60742
MRATRSPPPSSPATRSRPSPCRTFNGSTVSSDELLKKGPLAIVFYRGGWCPYCNLQLRALQKHHAAIQALGAEVVAFAPEKAELRRDTNTKHSLSFPLVQDVNVAYAEQLGLAFTPDPDTKGLFDMFGIDLESNSGSTKLPVPATLLVDKNGHVVLVHAVADYTTRLEPAVLVREIEGLAKNGGVLNSAGVMPPQYNVLREERDHWKGEANRLAKLVAELRGQLEAKK